MGLLGGALQAVQTGQLGNQGTGSGCLQAAGRQPEAHQPQGRYPPFITHPGLGSRSPEPHQPTQSPSPSPRRFRPWGGGWIDPQVPVLPELVKADARSRWLGDQLQNKSSGWQGLGSLCVEQGNYHHKLGAKDSSPRDLCSQGVPLE